MPLPRIRYCLTNLYFMNCKILFTAAAIAATTLVTSCTKEVDVDTNLSSHQTILAEFVEPDDALQTRSCVDVKNSTNSSISYHWEPGDQIGVYSADNSQRNVLFTNNSTKKAAQVEFDGDFNGTPYYAYYPYNAANNSASLSEVKGTILAEQPYNHNTGSFSCFYRYGVREEGSTTKFKFKSLLTMLKLTVDATDTALEGERLNKVVITVVGKNGETRAITGDFTFNLQNGDYNVKAGTTSNVLTMPWTEQPKLKKYDVYTGYVHLIPDVAAGDKITFDVITEGHKATFTAELKSGFVEGKVYNLPLTLKTYKANVSKYSYKETTIDRPTISSFKFEVSKNSGKLLNNELTWNSSKHTPSFSSVSTHTATIDNTTNEITLTIPYLYDFKLKPTFSITGSGCTVKVNGVEQTSGVTEVDFTKPVVYTVTNSEGGSRDYTVKVTNTGLPVVVINQSTSGDFKAESKNVMHSIINWHKITFNEFVDFMIRNKTTEFVKDDQITVYNPDGTVNCATTNCGVRLRGNTTKDYPKKPFAIKLTEKKSILGMPDHKRWVLLANWLDHSMIRNTVAFDIAHAVEYAWRDNGSIGEGIPWTPSGQNVELVFIENGEAHHVGNYFLCEQIKIDENRLDIAAPYNIDEPGVDDYKQYGFLIEGVSSDKRDEPSYFTSNNGIIFQFKDELSSTILGQVKTKMNRIEDNIVKGNYSAAYEELDINSLIDQMLIWELTLNREYGDPSSVFMYMNGDGKLSAGPVWDFDRGTFQNQTNAKNYGNSDRVKPNNEWMYWRKSSSESYIWYSQLAKDPIFQKTVKERWTVIKPYLDMIPSQIQYYGEALAKSYKYDSAMWPTNKADVQCWKDGFKDWSGDEEISDWDELINNFITVYNARLAGMDALITSGSFTK